MEQEQKQQTEAVKNVATAGSNEPAKEAVAQEAEEQEQLLFFNVMPKAVGTGEIIQPKIQIAEQPQTALENKDNSNFMESLKKYKLYIIIFLSLAILGPAIYFIINKFVAPSSADLDALKNLSGGQKHEEVLSDGGEVTTPEEWQKKYFEKEKCENIPVCGDAADPDRDGLDNLTEFEQKTDPNNPDSDKDNLADGDELNVFHTDPLESHTAKDPKYNDADFIMGGYDVRNPDKMLTAEQIKEMNLSMNKYGLHPPTISTLGDSLKSIYKFGQEAPPATPATTTPATTEKTPEDPKLTFEQTLEAKQDRDVRRTMSIKNLGIALVKYQEDASEFPKTQDFKEMHNKVKPYLKVAVNPEDPINADKYVYTYNLNEKGDDFTLTYFSEVANSLIKKHLADAQKDRTSEEAEIFDNQRRTDLEMLRGALLLYSNENAAGNQEYVFPTLEKYKTEIVPVYISQVPKDPKTDKDYEYKVAENFESFTLKATLDNPKAGTTGLLCNQEECRDY